MKKLLRFRFRLKLILKFKFKSKSAASVSSSSSSSSTSASSTTSANSRSSSTASAAPDQLPQRWAALPVLVRHGDLDPFAANDSFFLDLQYEASLREKQTRSEVLDRVAEFCQLDRANAEGKKEIMGMRLPAYNARSKAAIDLALPWLLDHSDSCPKS